MCETSRPDIVGLSKSFQPRQWFPHGFDVDCQGEIMWVYRPCDEGTGWLVGFFYPDGSWFTESRYSQGDPEKAAARVRWLNGG